MKTILVFVALLTASLLHADTIKKENDLQELLQIMNMDSIVESMYSQMEIMLQNTANEYGVQQSEQALFDEFYSRMVLVMREEMSWEKMKPKAMEIYSNNFTEKEISDMLDFYKTETGQSVLAKLPIVMQQSMEMSEALIRNAMPKIQQISEELKGELTKLREKEISITPNDAQ